MADMNELFGKTKKKYTELMQPVAEQTKLMTQGFLGPQIHGAQGAKMVFDQVFPRKKEPEVVPVASAKDVKRTPPVTAVDSGGSGKITVNLSPADKQIKENMAKIDSLAKNATPQQMEQITQLRQQAGFLRGGTDRVAVGKDGLPVKNVATTDPNAASQRTSTGLNVQFNSSVSPEARSAFMSNPSAPAPVAPHMKQHQYQETKPLPQTGLLPLFGSKSRINAAAHQNAAMINANAALADRELQNESPENIAQARNLNAMADLAPLNKKVKLKLLEQLGATEEDDSEELGTVLKKAFGKK